MDKNNLGLISAGVAFFSFFAIFPATAAIIALWGFWYDPMVIQQQLEVLDDLVPDEAYSVLEGQVNALIEANVSTLGWTTVLSLGLALWSARSGVDALLRGLNAIHGESNPHSFIRILVSLLLTVVLVAVALVALAAVVVIPVMLAFMPLGPLAGAVLGLTHWGMTLGVVILGIWLLYRFGPNRPSDQVGRVAPGIGFAVTLWALASVGFSYFLANFGSYNEIYGSIAAIIALLMWFYISAYAVLFGAALNAELDKLSQQEALGAQ